MTQQGPGKEETLWSGHPSQVVNFWVYVACALFCWLVIPIFFALWKWIVVRSVRYELTSQRILTTTGVFSKNTDSMELYRVKDLHVQEPFWFRLFGVGNVQMDTSDHTTPTLTFEAVENPRGLSDMIRNQVETLRALKGVRELDMGLDHGDGAHTG
ncbi:MAG: PH domain-containing protein [Candidatus Hydrogenedentes bacterium]|nr:PH domain-containing protein [Candidatus Hydrogenedentota bacterium]